MESTTFFLYRIETYVYYALLYFFAPPFFVVLHVLTLWSVYSLPMFCTCYFALAVVFFSSPKYGQCLSIALTVCLPCESPGFCLKKVKSRTFPFPFRFIRVESTERIAGIEKSFLKRDKSAVISKVFIVLSTWKWIVVLAEISWFQNLISLLNGPSLPLAADNISTRISAFFTVRHPYQCYQLFDNSIKGSIFHFYFRDKPIHYRTQILNTYFRRHSSLFCIEQTT